MAVYKPSARVLISICPPELAISKIERIIPITVPKNPIIGAAPDIVAKTLTFFSKL